MVFSFTSNAIADALPLRLCDAWFHQHTEHQNRAHA